MSDQVWYLQRGTQQFGPYRWEDVVELARTGRVEPTDLVFRPGDPESREARAIPGLLPGAAPSRPKWLIPAVLAGVAALAIVLIVVMTSGGDDEASDTTGTTRPPRTTTETTRPGETTTTSSASTTTSTSTTTTSTSTTTTSTTTTLAPTTTVALPTTDDLVAAIPLQADVPVDWFVPDDPIVTEPSPNTGPYYGICGGDNAAARAIEHGVVAYAAGPEYLPPEGAFYLAIYAFPTPEDASAFVQDSAAQVDCPSGIAYDRFEGDGPDQMDFFTEGYGDGEVVWNNLDRYELIFDIPSDSEEWSVYSWSSDHATTFEGTDYFLREDEVDIVERYGRIVITTSRYGTCCWSGFGNSDEIPAYTPDVLQLLAAHDQVMPYVLSVLTDRGLI